MKNIVNKFDLLSSIALSFEVNLGQIDEKAKFLARGNGYTAFFTSNKVLLGTINHTEKIGVNKFDHNMHHEEGETSLSENYEVTTFGMKLEGCNLNAEIVGEEELPGKVNYLKGNDKNKWKTNISTYAKIRYIEIYPGIDLVYYGNKGQLEHDFIIKPGADPNNINLSFEGIEKIEPDDEGNLLISVKNNQVKLLKPKVYQEVNAVKKEIESNFNVKNLEHVGFKLGDYNKEKPLIIDPILMYSTYLGGSNSDYGTDIAVDNYGNAYITGWTYSNDFPLENPYQDINKGGRDAFVTKLTADGSNIVYSTYLGGNLWDCSLGITIDNSGKAYITGWTDSNNFPITIGAFQTSKKGYTDAFVTKLTSDGSDLVYSTYLGGRSSNYGLGIAIDVTENIYVTGYTRSSNFPITIGAFQTSKASSSVYYDSFVTKLNIDGSDLVYSTYLGGSNNDYARDIAVDNTGSAYINGRTKSNNFPTTIGAFQTLKAGIVDVFVTKLSSDGSELVYSTYLGGSDSDSGDGIAIDNTGSAYVTGGTSSDDFPTTIGAFQTLKAGLYDVFVTKLTPNGTGLVYSTLLGGSNDDYGGCITIDDKGNAYITGSTYSEDFPLKYPIQDIRKGNRDAFVTKLSEDGSEVIYSTYLGGSSSDLGNGIAVNCNGIAYITGETNSDDFPLQNPYQDTLKGNTSAFVVKIIDIPEPKCKIRVIVKNPQITAIVQDQCEI